jgi:hypothetical protein
MYIKFIVLCFLHSFWIKLELKIRNVTENHMFMF